MFAHFDFQMTKYQISRCQLKKTSRQEMPVKLAVFSIQEYNIDKKGEVGVITIKCYSFWGSCIRRILVQLLRLYKIDSWQRGAVVMNKTITATYSDNMALKNVVDELVNKDIPRENFFTDEEISQVKVMMPESAEPEILEILYKHDPTEVH